MSFRLTVNNNAGIRKNILAIFLVLSAFHFSNLNAQNIYTIAGNGTAGYSGDGGPATAAELNYPNYTTTDIWGNIYITDLFNHCIRKINTSGIISTVAGNGTFGFSGDGGPATAAELYYPTGVIADTSGNIYIADNNNCRIRKVDTSGIISTVAGNGAQGFSGDGGPATAAELCYPISLVMDTSGNIYISDNNNHRIRKLNTSGIISTAAGTGVVGFSGDGGPATAAELYSPDGLTIDASGNIYYAEDAIQRVRKINTSGIISTIAGKGTPGFSGDGAAATAAKLYSPEDVSMDASHNMYIADRINQRIRKVNASGIISTIAGNGTASFSGDGGPATAAEFNMPYGVHVDVRGNIYVTDQNNQCIREISSIFAISASVVNVKCNGDCNASALVTASGGNPSYKYSWAPSGGTRATASNLCAGNYTVTVTDAFGHSVTASSTITQPAVLVDGTPILNLNAACFGGTGSATAAMPTGGTSPYTYSWNGGATSTNVTNTALSAGTYTVNVTDAHGCMVNSAGIVTITQPATALTDSVPTLSFNATCFGGNGSATAANPSGGVSPYTYSWNGGATSINATNAALSAGTYTVNITDANGCTINSLGTVTITQPAALNDATPTLNFNIACFGGTGNATAAIPTGGTSPYTYAWNGGTTSTKATNTGLSAGTYTVNITDANGCTGNSSSPVTITQPAVLADGTPILNFNVPCFGGTGSATAAIPTGGTSPYTYAWNGGATSTNATNAALSAGTYTVNVIDAHGCTVNSAGTVTITQPAALNDATPTLNFNIACFGGNGSATAAIPTGGTSPYTYAWNGGTTSTNATNAGLSAGTYTVNITDVQGCTVNSSNTITITQPAAIADTHDSINDNGSCIGLAAVIASGGTIPYTYLWSPNGQTTDTIKRQCAGTYCCTITDNNGCSINTCVSVNIILGVTDMDNSSVILLYPNPNNGQFTIESSGISGQSVVEVYNMLGEKIYTTKINSLTTQLDLRNNPNGIYLYRVLSETRNLVSDGKFIIQK